MMNILALSSLQEIRDTVVDPQTLVFIAGPAGGTWISDGTGDPEQDNGGTVVIDRKGMRWRRQCDPADVDARWFGVAADGVQDDAPALQRALDALPLDGGRVRLPGGHMRCGQTLKIHRAFVTLEGVNCGLRSRHFEPSHELGRGSLLRFDPGVDGIVIQPENKNGASGRDRLGGVTLRNFGIAGEGRDAGQSGIIVKPGEDWEGTFGSTDALLLERLYVIDMEWAVFLTGADASILTNNWFSECGNGVRLLDCVYTTMQGLMIADNDHIGIRIEGGVSQEMVGCTFVRNQHALLATQAESIRVTGGVFGADVHDNGRCQQDAFVVLRGCENVLMTGAIFRVAAPQTLPPVIQRDNCGFVEYATSRFVGCEP